MAGQVQIRPEPAEYYRCHPNVLPDYEFCKRLGGENQVRQHGSPYPPKFFS